MTHDVEEDSACTPGGGAIPVTPITKMQYDKESGAATFE